MSSSYGSSFCALPECLADAPNPKAPQEGIHLYHFGGSYYSQPPRQVLYESDIKWTSHVINLTLMDQYKTSYVELNPYCVVPTLIKDGKVTTDCDNILSKFTKEFTPHLIPKNENERICMEQWLKNVQKININALTYGTIPGFPKPWWIERLNFHKRHEYKKEALSKFISKHENDYIDQFFLHAYKTKLQLISEYQRQFTDEEFMNNVFASVIELLDNIEIQLSAAPASSSTDGNDDDDGDGDKGGFLCSKEYSLVDLYYGIFLHRLCYLNMGIDRLWGSFDNGDGQKDGGSMQIRPNLAKYCTRLFARPSFKSAIEEYGGWKLAASVGTDFIKNLFYRNDSV